MRVKLTIAYDGTLFFGSQEQSDRKSVAGELNLALRKINIHNKVIMSSRTDRGVHATGQTLHLDLPDNWRAEKLLYPLKRALPNGISLLKVDSVSNDFHSRFHAKDRTYRYVISTANPNPFQERFITFIDGGKFEFSKIERGIELFIGRHNFKNFRKVGSNNRSDVREIFEAKAYKWRGVYILKFRANSFLRSQIRMIVGTLIAVANNQLTIDEVREQLTGERIYTTRLAPPNGLYLAKVSY